MNTISRILIFIVNLVFGIAILLLLVRFLLRLFGANLAAPFADWIYDVTSPLLYPFIGIFPSPVVEGGFVFEITTLIAIVIYAVIAYIIAAIIRFLIPNKGKDRRD